MRTSKYALVSVIGFMAVFSLIFLDPRLVLAQAADSPQEDEKQNEDKETEEPAQTEEEYHTVVYEVPAPDSNQQGVYQASSSSTEEPSYDERPPRTGSRVAAHVFFWIGIDGFAGGAIYFGTGTNEETGAGLMVAGGTFMVIGIVCAAVYHSKFNAWKSRQKMGALTPVVSPDYRGLDYTLTF